MSSFCWTAILPAPSEPYGRTGQFISADPITRYQTIQWVMWQMGKVGPTFGQVGFFNKFAGKTYGDKRPRGCLNIVLRSPLGRETR